MTSKSKSKRTQMSVAEYMRKKAPAAYALLTCSTTHDHVESLDKHFPIDSACGDDCKRAIDAAVAFRECATMGFGKRYHDDIDTILVETVLVFAFG